MSTEPQATFVQDVPQQTQIEIPYTIIEALLGNRGSEQKVLAERILANGDVLIRKNTDYGCSVWKTPYLAPYMEAKSAILVRMSDKIERIRNLISGGMTQVSTESLEDTIGDLAAYCLLYLSAPVQVSQDPQAVDLEQPVDRVFEPEIRQEFPTEAHTKFIGVDKARLAKSIEDLTEEWKLKPHHHSIERFLHKADEVGLLFLPSEIRSILAADVNLTASMFIGPFIDYLLKK